MDLLRLNRLNKLLDGILNGKQNLSPHNSANFLEAICNQPDPSACIARIIGSPAGPQAIQSTMKYDLSTTFLNGSATKLLQYLQHQDVAQTNGGEYLRTIITKISDPPIFLSEYRAGFVKGTLSSPAEHAFSWLLLQLVSLPGDSGAPYREHEQNSKILEKILSHEEDSVRSIGRKIKHVLETCDSSNVPISNGSSPGGRHDNDFVDFRKIALSPTAEEISCTEEPFIRTSDFLEDPEKQTTRVADHLDNQFRLLREDMLYEMKEELQIMFGKKKGHRKGVTISDLELIDVHCGDGGRRTKWGIILKAKNDFPQLKGEKDRKEYLVQHRNFLKHQSLVCLVIGGEIIGFPTIYRDETLLAKKPPEIILQLEGEETTIKALLKLKLKGDVKLIQIDTAMFSYGPVLKALQQANSLPLSEELLHWKEDDILEGPLSQADPVIEALRRNPSVDLKTILGTKSIKLDTHQSASLLSGLTQRVSLIQGPPGTGKSFIGALLAKSLVDFTTQKILVVCYTNHALDDILTSLLDIGIAETSMVRLGGKSTTRTEPLTLQKQVSTFRRGKADWAIVDGLKQTSADLCNQLELAFKRFLSSNVRQEDILDYLEFEEPEFHAAFLVPTSSDGMTRVGKGGRNVDRNYLLNQWSIGWDAGIFHNEDFVRKASSIWDLHRKERDKKYAEWTATILNEMLAEIYSIAKEYNQYQDRLTRAFSQNVIGILESKRIIGCTTTAAAKYAEDIQAAAPNVLLIEEAGEILESHVLTALSSSTNQVILIGDHKQLRPKVNNYTLTVEKGEGYDLNRSLFERLILRGFPHQTLSEQHRMRPEISALIRHLTYPELVDAARTKNRDNLKGVQDNIVFISHDHPEDVPDDRLKDKRDMNSTSSKQNSYEAGMVLKIVRYLGQQGYGTEKLVILTPYLGQLMKLRELLKVDNDPVLNDLDSHDLVSAGIITHADAKYSKKPIRLATIDNYQGEESDVVIISLTRSNSAGDIGFMSSPERLNVLLSRARDAMIMIGNFETFKKSKKGGVMWGKLFDLLKDGKHIYDGLPVFCERHRDKKAVLREPDDFMRECPDGGCTIPCGVMLKCGVHACPSKCHQLFDHSKMQCKENMSNKCSNGHEQTWQCYRGTPATCRKCERETKQLEEKRKRDLAAKAKKDADDQAHLQRIAEIDAEILKELQIRQDAALEKEREDILKQKQRDLEDARNRNIREAGHSKLAPRFFTSTPPAPAPASPPAPASTSTPTPASSSAPAPPASPSTPFTTSFLSRIVQNLTSLTTGNETPQPDAAGSNAVPNQPNNSTQTKTVTPDNEMIIPPSQSKIEWQRQKDMEGANNQSLDAVMDMVGLESVKEQLLNIKIKIDTAIRQGTSLKKDRFNTVLLGNPGTGKTTVARHYAKFLSSVGVLPGDVFIETTGSSLGSEGVDAIKKQLDQVKSGGGGAIFVDEAYQLTSAHNMSGKQVLDFLLAEMENNVGKLVFIFAGYTKEMEKFFEHNPGLPSRVPYSFRFDDYKDNELLHMLEGLIEKRFEGRMKVEGGVRGLYTRIAIRRVGRRRGRNGFGNARELTTVFDLILKNQAVRIHNERKKGNMPDDFLLSAEDLIGPEPSAAMAQSKAWKRLQALIGLTDVKESVRNLFDMMQTNYHRELSEKEPLEVSLNRVFLGSPGTGKTSVAKLYGAILAELRLLSNGEVVIKNPSDFVGSALGESETNTKAILQTTVGKVLIIDEAYMLYEGGETGKGSQTNIYKTSVIDTIVAEVQSVPGDDRCVLMLGYKDQMVEMFQNVNPGLSRRFKIEDAFNFADFNNAELLQILELKMKDQNLDATADAKNVAIELLDRARNRPNFGNAGDVENAIGQAKAHYMGRFSRIPAHQRPIDIVFEPQDFDPDYQRNANASTNLDKLFEDIVGSEHIVTKLKNYQKIAEVSKKRKLDPREQIPTNFIFKGPPGTGKTTVARKMGQVYYDMGILSSRDVIECSATDLVGQYVGQTGPKTKKLLEKALGKVLFVDEAYRLGEGHFAKEAIDELVGLITHPTFKSKVIIILAGYDHDMNRLMTVNTGLSSRFPEQVIFSNMGPKECLEVVYRELRKKNIQFEDLKDAASDAYQEMSAIVEEMIQLSDWGNARDMVTLSKDLISVAFLKEDVEGPMVLTKDEAVACMRAMLKARQERLDTTGARKPSSSKQPMESLTPNPPSPPRKSVTKTKTKATTTKAPPPKAASPPPRIQSPVPQNPNSPNRDPGVSDAVWNSLQKAKRLQAEMERAARQAIQKLQKELEAKKRAEKAHREKMEELARQIAAAKEEAERRELMRKREIQRLQELAAKAERERAMAALRAKQEEEQRRKQQEAKAQAKLRQMGVCPVGYQWIREGSYYRCAGGSHTVSLSQLGM